MARYLSPAKIGLLVLIELYVEEQVPSDAVLPILTFITSHLFGHATSDPLLEKDTRWGKAERTVSLVTSIKDFETLLGSYPFVIGMPGRRLWDQFLEKMWGISSLHGLYEFFDDISNMIGKTKAEMRRQVEAGGPDREVGVKLSRTSPFGVYIRRAQLEYDRLQFHYCAELWKEFVRYRQPTAPYLKRRVPGFSRLSFDNVLRSAEPADWDPERIMGLAAVTYGDMLTGDRNGTFPVTMDDIENLLEFQIEQMQRYGNRIPLEIRHQFHDLLNDSYMLPSLRHYLSFLDSWRGGDHSTAFDFLHRYFDYTMQNQDRLFYQYALMNLAVLQADFGCYKESIAAMLETVSTARENRDMTCLNFALNWLFHFGRAHPELVKGLQSNSMLGTGKESLAFLRVKARETSMWTLWSSALLSEAKLGLAKGESIATSLEFMAKSSQLIVEYNMKSMFGSQLALKSALWERMGLTYLSATTSEVYLRCHTDCSTFEDELRTTCQLAFLVALRGKYDEAFERLDKLEDNSLRSCKPTQYWLKHRGIIKLKKDLHNNNLNGAERLLEQLLQSRHDDLEPEMAFMIDDLHVDYLARRGDLETAFTKVNSMMSKLRDDQRDITLRVQVLLFKASLLEKCGRPQRGFSLVMRAASISWRSRLIPQLWQSIGALSNILTTLGEFEAAANLLTAIIPRAIECGSAALTARLYSYLADANMGLAGAAETKFPRRMEYMTKAAVAVQKAFDSSSLVGDIQQQCQLMAKKAMIMKLSGDMVLAANYAAAYVELRKDAERLSVAHG